MQGKLGAGTAILMVSQFIAVAANYGINVGIGRILGPEIYGIFGLIMSLYLINRAFLNVGIPRSVSKFLAESHQKLSAIFRTSIKLQLLFSSSFGLIYLLFAPIIAIALKDEALKFYIMFLGVMVIPMAIRSIYTNGYLNGLHLFKQQAIVKIAHHLIRVVLVFTFIFLGFKVWGILFAYFVSVVISVWIAHRFIRKKLTKDSGFSKKKIIMFSLPISISALSLTLIKNSYPLFIKSLLLDNTLVGFYTAAAALSNVSYMVFQSLPVTLMPSISKSTSSDDLLLTRKYISQSLRYLLLLVLPIAALIAASSKELVTMFFSAAYIQAAPVLSILIFSSTLLVIFLTLASIISGSGKPKIEMMIVLASVVMMVSLNFYLIPSFGIVGAAITSMITSLFSLTVAGIYVYYKFRVLMSSLSFVRILVGAVVIFGLASVLGYQGLWLIVMYLGLLLLYFLLLLVVGEIKDEDIKLFKKIIKGFTSISKTKN